MTNKNFNAKNVIFTAVAAIALSFVFTTTASAEDIRVKSSENIRVKGTENIRVKGTENIRVKGTENIRVKGTENIRVKSDKDSTNDEGNVFTDFLNRIFGVRV